MATDRAAFLAVPAAAALLLWPAAWNGYPIVFADTGTYLGQAIHRFAGWDRPVFYSLFMLPLHATVTVWPVIVVQAVLAAWVLWLVCRVLLPRVSRIAFVGGAAVLAVVTWLPWIVSELMPDVFTPLLILVICLLTRVPERLSRRECVGLAGLAAFMIACQQSSLPLACVLLAVPGVWSRSFSRNGRPSGGLSSPCGASFSLNRHGQACPGHPPFARRYAEGRDTPGHDNRGGAGDDDKDALGHKYRGGLGHNDARRLGRDDEGSPGRDTKAALGHDMDGEPGDNIERVSDQDAELALGYDDLSPPGTDGCLDRQRPRRWPLIVLPPALALLALCSVNLAAYGRFVVSPFGNVFLLARVIYDGPGMAVLRRDCPAAGWLLCPFLGGFPPTSDEFLWTQNSPLLRAGGPKAVSQDADAIIRAALIADPAGEVSATLANTLEQLSRFASGDGLNPWPEQVSHEIKHDFSTREGALYASARQQGGSLSVPPVLARLHLAVALAGVIGCMLLLPIALVRRAPCAGFLLVVLIALPVSAAITGGLSAPHDRYQSRIMWLPPFIAVVSLASLRQRTA
jgi:hypothetical protein